MVIGTARCIRVLVALTALLGASTAIAQNTDVWLERADGQLGQPRMNNAGAVAYGNSNFKLQRLGQRESTVQTRFSSTNYPGFTRISSFHSVFDLLESEPGQDARLLFGAGCCIPEQAGLFFGDGSGVAKAVITKLDPAITNLVPAVGSSNFGSASANNLGDVAFGIGGSTYRYFVVPMGTPVPVAAADLLEMPPPVGRVFNAGNPWIRLNDEGSLLVKGMDGLGAFLAIWNVGDPSSSVIADGFSDIRGQTMNDVGTIVFMTSEAGESVLYSLSSGGSPVELLREGDGFGTSGETFGSLNANVFSVNNLGSILFSGFFEDSGSAVEIGLFLWKNGVVEKLIQTGANLDYIELDGDPSQRAIEQISDFRINDLDQIVATVGNASTRLVAVRDATGGSRCVPKEAILGSGGGPPNDPLLFFEPIKTRDTTRYLVPQPSGGAISVANPPGCFPCPCCSGAPADHFCFSEPSCSCAQSGTGAVGGLGGGAQLVGVKLTTTDGLPPLATLTLPEFVGDGQYAVQELNAAGMPIGTPSTAIGGLAFDLTSLNPNGVASLQVSEIEPSEDVTTADPTALSIGVSFVAGDDSAFQGGLNIVPEPSFGCCLGAGLLVLFQLGAGRSRRRSTAIHSHQHESGLNS